MPQAGSDRNDGKARPARRFPSVRVLILEAVAVCTLVALAGGAFLVWALSRGPLPLDFVRPTVESALTDARGGEPVTIGKLTLEWSRERGRLQAVALDVSAHTGEGGQAAWAQRTVIGFEPLALLSGAVRVKGVRVEQGEADVRRSKAGQWTLAGITIFQEPRLGGRAFNPFTDINWPAVATPLRAFVAAGDFDRIELVDMRVRVIDEASGSVWTLRDVDGRWRSDQQRVGLDLAAQLSEQLDANRLHINLAADAAVTRASGLVELDGVAPEVVAEWFGFAGDGITEARPASASLEIEVSEAAGFESGRLRMTDGNGRFRAGDLDIAVEDLDFVAEYDPVSQYVTVTEATILSDRLSGTLTAAFGLGSITAWEAGGLAPFAITGADVTLDMTPTFEMPWTFSSVDLAARFGATDRRLVLDRLTAVTGDLTVNGAGELWLADVDGTSLLGLKLDATSQGTATPAQLQEFWPVNLGAAGREWTAQNIRGGVARDAVLKVDWPPGANREGFLPDEHLSLDFRLEDGTVGYLSDFPPITEARATGRLMGNSLSISIESGRVGGWQIDEGSVALPRFYPGGAMLEVKGAGRGGLRDLMRVLNQSNLKVGDSYGLDIERMSGEGGLELVVQQEMRTELDARALKFSVRGGFMNASAPDLFAGFGLTDSDVRVELDQDTMTLSGAGRFGPSPIVYTWKENFKPGSGPSSELTSRAVVTPDLLNAFGLAARNVMQGEAQLDLRASGDGRDFNSIFADLDLTKAAIDLSEVRWSKPFDAPARGTFRYAKSGEDALLTGDIRGDGLELTGEASVDPQGEVKSARIERLFSRGGVDMRGDLTRRADGGVRLNLSGPFFDASPWMDQVLGMTNASASRPEPAGAASAGGPAAASPPGEAWEFSLAADRLLLRENAELKNAKLVFEMAADGPRKGVATGSISPTQGIELLLDTDAGWRTVNLTSDDAGFATRVLLDADYLVGGSMKLTGRFGEDGGSADVTMANVRLLRAPLVAQLLSLASLRGLADVLSGEGVLFTRVDAPVAFHGGRMDFPGLRASGPAMGLTARGWIAPAAGELSLDGVLVPSFGINSALGGIPIIGDLFVSREGEGLFAPTYSVRGTFQKARVTVNPVAAITPGVLRRIFENPATAPPLVEADPHGGSTP